MTTPVAVVGLVWDDYDVQRADLDIFVEIVEGLDDLPRVRGNDQVIPFRSGRLPVPGIADGRAIVGNGWIAGGGSVPRVRYRAYLDALKAKLDPTQGPKLLVATLEDGSLRWIHAIPRSLLPGESIGGEFRWFSIEWKACDPFWYGIWDVLDLDEGLRLDAGLTLDQARTLVITPTSSPFSFTFDAFGTAEVEKVRIEIDGPSTGAVSLRNLEYATDNSLGFSHPALGVGETLVVDTGLRTVTLNDVNARGNLTLFANNRGGEYLRLRPGNNTLRAAGTPAQIRLIFYPTYL
jgi:hypothetical protein